MTKYPNNPDKSLPNQSPSTNFYFIPIKFLDLPLVITSNGSLKFKKKKENEN